MMSDGELSLEAIEAMIRDTAKTDDEIFNIYLHNNINMSPAPGESIDDWEVRFDRCVRQPIKQLRPGLAKRLENAVREMAAGCCGGGCHTDEEP
jgi:hypothetical protein